METEQRYYDDLEPGDDVTPLQRQPTHEQIKAFVSISGTPGPGQYRFFSDEVARSEGLKGAIVPGSFNLSFLSRWLSEWAGQDGRLRELDVSFRRLASVGDPLECRGIIVDKEIVSGEGHVRIDVSIHNLTQGDTPTVGSATVILPLRP